MADKIIDRHADILGGTPVFSGNDGRDGAATDAPPAGGRPGCTLPHPSARPA